MGETCVELALLRAAGLAVGHGADAKAAQLRNVPQKIVPLAARRTLPDPEHEPPCRA